MSYQEELISLGTRDAYSLSETERENRIETTMTKTFSWMAGLLLVAFWTARAISSGTLVLPFSSGLYLFSSLGWFALVLLISRRWQSMSYQTIAWLLIAFALLEWYGLSGVFAMYSLGSVQQVFLTTSILFISLVVAGKYMQVDIMKVWNILMISLVALIIASIINIFRWNEQFNIWISLFGVVIFSGFIIYDMQVLKQQALVQDERLPLLMSLWLFLNFINIFLFLLRLMGSRD